MLPPDPLRWQVAGNSLGAWLIALGVLVGAIAVLYVVKSIALRRLEAVASRTSTHVDDMLVGVVRRTRFYFVFFLALEFATRFLDLPARADTWIGRLTVAAVALQCIRWGNAGINFFVRRYARRHGDDGGSRTTITAFGYFIRTVFWIIVVIFALRSFGVEITPLLTGLGVGGIAIALAVQNVLGDLFGALSIVLDKPFVVGDAIAVDNFDGTVEHVGLKTTRLRATSGEQLIFANADLLKARIRNYKRMRERRVQFATGIEYAAGADAAARVPAMLREIVSAQQHVRFDRAHLKRLGEAGPEYETVYYVTTPEYAVFMDVQQTINLEIFRRFTAEAIPFATPTRTVVVRSTPGDTVAGTADGAAIAAAAAGGA